MTKQCAKCGFKKLLTEFSRVSRNKDGLHNSCKICYAEYMKIWSRKNSTVVNARVLAYHHKNKKALNEKRKIRWHKSDKSENAENSRAWKIANPEQVKILRLRGNHKRRARLATVDNYQIFNKEIKAILQKPCFYCGTTNGITLDHVVPISRGGNNGIGNLLPACLSCNTTKKNKFITEWKLLQIKIKESIS